MINFTFTDPDTGLDVVWPLLIKKHTPLLEKQFNVTADAADYLDPDTVHKGGYDTTSLTTGPLEASEMPMFLLFRRATRKGEVIVVGASVVPVIAHDYIAKREGDLRPIEMPGHRFSFALNLRYLEAY